MIHSVVCASPAKINLHLEVGGRGKDGFHPVLSLFQAVDLMDILRIDDEGSGAGCLIDGPFDCVTSDNLIYRAAELFFVKTGWQRKLRVTVKKRIPARGGLGGGSSNAAAMLKALVLLSGIDPGSRAMMDMAACLGSDVPFFLGAAASLVTGRGEFLQPLVPRTDYSLVLVIPDFQRGTAEAFRRLDQARKAAGKELCFTMSPEEICRRFRLDPEDWGFFNSFLDDPVPDPEEVNCVRLLKRTGASYVGMTGSGSTFFGVFRDAEQAEKAKADLLSRFPEVMTVIPLDRIPVAVVN